MKKRQPLKKAKGKIKKAKKIKRVRKLRRKSLTASSIYLNLERLTSGLPRFSRLKRLRVLTSFLS